MATGNNRPETIHAGDPVIVIATGKEGKCTSRPGTKYFVNFGNGEKGGLFAKEELKKLEKDKNQTSLFDES